MNRLWTGVAAGLLAATALVGVGVAAYNAGQDDDRVTRVITEDSETGDGEVVRVVERDGWRHGPGFGFFLFPLLIIGGIVLIARSGRHHHGYWGHGGWGPGRWGEPDERVREYHRRLHEDDERVTPSGTPPEQP